MKRQKIILNIMTMLMGAVCGGAGINAIALIVPKEDFGIFTIYASTLVILVITYILIFIHTFIHETGHMVFGLLTGYRFSSIRFLSFMFVKSKDGSIRLKRHKVAGTGGQCLMLPPEEKNGTYPYMLYNMGGCIFNLIAGIAAIALYNITDDGIISVVWMITGIVGIFTCLINGIPIKAASNDGYNTLVFSRSKTALRIFIIQLNIVEGQSRGVPVSDMPDEWFKYLEGVDNFDNLINISGYVTAIGYYIDKRDFERVKEMCFYVGENAKEILPVHEAIIKAESLFAYLVTDMDKDKIEELTGKECMVLYNLLKSWVSMNRVWYAYYKLYKTDSQKAQKYLDMVNKAEKTYPYPADFITEKELITYVDNICDSSAEAE